MLPTTCDVYLYLRYVRAHRFSRVYDVSRAWRFGCRLQKSCGNRGEPTLFFFSGPHHFKNEIRRRSVDIKTSPDRQVVFGGTRRRSAKQHDDYNIVYAREYFESEFRRDANTYGLAESRGYVGGFLFCFCFSPSKRFPVQPENQASPAEIAYAKYANDGGVGTRSRRVSHTCRTDAVKRFPRKTRGEKNKNKK